MEDILKGAYDMHIHTSPDVSPRKSTDIEIAEEWKTAGMKGGVVKCHFADTTGRAAILSALSDGLLTPGGKKKELDNDSDLLRTHCDVG